MNTDLRGEGGVGETGDECETGDDVLAFVSVEDREDSGEGVSVFVVSLLSMCVCVCEMLLSTVVCVCVMLLSTVVCVCVIVFLL